MLDTATQKQLANVLDKLPPNGLTVYFPEEYNFSEEDKLRLIGKMMIAQIKIIMAQQQGLIDAGMPVNYPFEIAPPKQKPQSTDKDSLKSKLTDADFAVLDKVTRIVIAQSD